MSSLRSNVVHQRTGQPIQQGPPQTVTAGFVLDALRRWWKVSLPLGLILAATAASVVYVLFEPVYEAEAYLEIKDAKPYVAFRDQDSSRRFVQTQIALLRTPMVLSRVVSNPEIARLPEFKTKLDPFLELREKIKIETVGGSELLRVAYAGPSAVNAAKILNAVVDSYLKLHEEADARRVQQVIELLETQRTAKRKIVEQLRQEYKNLSKSVTGEDPFVTEKKQIRPDPLGDLENELARLEVDRALLEARTRVFKEQIEKEDITVTEAVIDQAVEGNPEIQQAEAILKARRESLADYDAKYTEKGKDNPRYLKLKKTIEEEEKELAELRETTRKKIQASIADSQLAQRKAELARMEAEVKDRKLQEQLLREKCDSGVEDRTLATGLSVELEYGRVELERAEKVFDLISQRVEQLRTEQRAPPRVTLWQKATPPTGPVKDNPNKLMAISAMGMFCLPFFLAVVWERLIGRVSDSHRFEEATRIRVVGEIARLPARNKVFQGGSAERAGRGITLFEESIDSLRTYLVLSENLKEMKALAVTSSVNSEGKTSVAIQLAVSIARASGQPTLLIDGDMRSPDIHRKLDIPLEPGLAQVLNHECTLEEAIVTDWSKYLHLLPAGVLRASPHKLLGNGAVRPLFDQIRESYRYVIIDTPPILAASEALVLAKAADAALVCAMRDVSRIDQIRRTEQRLASAGTKPIGVVLNAVPGSRYAYQYGNYAYSRE
ncbi:MAG: polysaccharide biosynthesis tyrosine autokinase [Pirellulales bacterium]|nr:polysaccharide biosynthesis tyrosine autokinase [Pirellulales bacterium]